MPPSRSGTKFSNGRCLSASIAAVCTALVALTYLATAERIAANEQAWLEQSLQPALSSVTFDGSLTDSRVTLAAPHDLPGSEDAALREVWSAGHCPRADRYDSAEMLSAIDRPISV